MRPTVHPRLDALLAIWERYQNAGGARDLGVRTTEFWASRRSDFDEMVDECDWRDAQAVDAAVWDLPQIERTAIMHMHLAAAWRSSREPIAAVYERARALLSTALLRRQIP